MRKIIYTLLVGIICSGCSVLKSTRSIQFDPEKGISNEGVLNRVIENNISNVNFFIEKAEIEFSGSDKNKSIIGSLKYEISGKFLISLKTKTGIEFTRIFLENDSLKINDRINRKYYRGSSDKLLSEFRIAPEFLPLIIGDLLGDIIEDKAKTYSKNEIITTTTVFKGKRIIYHIDSRRAKVILAELNYGNSEDKIDIMFSKITKQNGITFPKFIEIISLAGRVKINIKKINVLINNTIEFVPGKGYKIVQIL